MNMSVATRIACVRHIMATVATTALVAAASSSASADSGRHVPAGTLTWKIVYTAHLAEGKLKGPEADIAKAVTNGKWTVTGRARLVGVAANGALDTSGNNATDAATEAPPQMESIEKAAQKCGNNQACLMAAMMKLRQHPNQTAALQQYGNTVTGVLGREDLWSLGVPGSHGSCLITASGKQTSVWNGTARFQGLRAVNTIAVTARDNAAGNSTYQCAGLDQSAITLQADPVSKVFNLSLPGTQLDMNHVQQFTVPRQNPTFHAKTHVALPAIALKGLSFAGEGHVLHGEHTIHRVGILPAAKREVRLTMHASTSVEYADAQSRPAIPLDAHVTWTFTPNHR